MIKAFCPGHISCFFSPVRTADVMTTGSLGAGIRLDKGTFVTVEERSDRKLVITMDGVVVDARITERTIRSLSPDRGFDVTIENQLPVSQGMGMSAAGAIAAGLCVSLVEGMSEYDAYRAAHIAEVSLGGGLGDVAGIMGGRQPIRVSAGIPPFGRTIDSMLSMNVTVAMTGPGRDTGTVLSDTCIMNKITEEGARCVSEYLNERTERSLYELSSRFSGSAGLETDNIRDALTILRKDHRASVCMLGGSIFTDASEDSVRSLLGDVEAISCSSSAEGPRIIHRA
ncbi:MAG: pantothenate kinase [Methanomassiliicoccaceae archaeon]|nr:pantothenate kinase [Methanomassiliicoccaceae archaeon]